jgi:hypothetical protein
VHCKTSSVLATCRHLNNLRLKYVLPPLRRWDVLLSVFLTIQIHVRPENGVGDSCGLSTLTVARYDVGVLLQVVKRGGATLVGVIQISIKPPPDPARYKQNKGEIKIASHGSRLLNAF